VHTYKVQVRTLLEIEGTFSAPIEAGVLTAPFSDKHITDTRPGTSEEPRSHPTSSRSLKRSRNGQNASCALSAHKDQGL
jgi:hypothetical protein